ncbi:MAG: ABC transporter permease [Albidovulum sp.]|nr:ABC transporter permease [Albidovulum sp.]MDE0530839.1 ABC transporter permease [Albidovulum sp.]
MIHLAIRPLVHVGRAFLAGLQSVGRISIFAAEGVSHIARPPFYFREFFQALASIGFFSLPVVGLTAFFTGGALALQIYAGGSRFSAESAVPSIVAIGMARELGPVLCGLMVAGRVASSIAAELGTMKVTEQIDALVTLSTNPQKYLVAPRIAAATVAMPVLAGIGDIIGILGGYVVGVSRLDFNPDAYLRTTTQFLQTADVVSGLVKAAAFGFIVAVVGCYHGMNSERGAKGVGRATTNAVATSSVLIIATNFVLTEIFFAA